MNDNAKGPGDEMADLFEVTLSDDGESIVVDGSSRPIPRGSSDDYVKLADNTNLPRNRKLLLSIAKWIADRESEYHQQAGREALYTRDLPETVRRLEAEVQELLDRVAALESE